MPMAWLCHMMLDAKKNKIVVLILVHLGIAMMQMQKAAVRRKIDPALFTSKPALHSDALANFWPVVRIDIYWRRLVHVFWYLTDQCLRVFRKEPLKCKREDDASSPALRLTDDSKVFPIQ